MKESIEVKIIEANTDFVRVQLPFLEIPVQMNHQFLKTRLESGYFKVRQSEN
jgi:hypothetical protein